LAHEKAKKKMYCFQNDGQAAVPLYPNNTERTADVSCVRRGKDNLHATCFHELQELNQNAADCLFGSNRQFSVGFQRMRRWNSEKERF
jgi:hypothetical protein